MHGWKDTHQVTLAARIAIGAPCTVFDAATARAISFEVEAHLSSWRRASAGPVSAGLVRKQSALDMHTAAGRILGLAEAVFKLAAAIELHLRGQLTGLQTEHSVGCALLHCMQFGRGGQRAHVPSPGG